MEQYKYTIKGTILGSRRYEDYTENIPPENWWSMKKKLGPYFSPTKTET